MASPATSKVPKTADSFRKDAERLAFVLEQLVEMMPQPYGCGSCTEACKCVLHRRREAALAALAEHRRPR